MKVTIKHSILFSIFSNTLYYIIAFPVLKILTKIVYDLKIEGMENIRNIDESVISVSNHVLVLDCAMVGLSYGIKNVYYTAQEESFYIPFVRYLVKLLKGIPVPKKLSDKKQFVKVIDEALKEGKSIHFYPEAELISYDDRIRPFKNGAFDFAVRNNVAVIPMAFCFREPVGLRRFLKRKKDVTLVVLEPVKCEESNESIQAKTENLKDEVYRRMNEVLIEKEYEYRDNMTG